MRGQNYITVVANGVLERDIGFVSKDNTLTPPTAEKNIYISKNSRNTLIIYE